MPDGEIEGTLRPRHVGLVHGRRAAGRHVVRRGEKVEDFPDWTLEAAEADAAFARDLFDRLAGVDEEAVDHEDWISLRLLRWNLGMLVEAPEYYWADFNITPYAAG